MISEILKKIKREYKFDPFVAPACVNMQRHIKLFYPLGTGHGFFVKITEGNQAQKEYLALQNVGKEIERNVQSPLGLIESPPHTAFITPLIDQRPLTISDLQYNKICVQIDEILRFTVSSRGAYNLRTPITVKTIYRFIKSQSVGNKLLIRLNRYLDSLVCDCEIEHYYSCPQHGDLTLYNFGIHHGTVILFDWEDYGRIGFAGYDLATFLLSIILACNEYVAIEQHPAKLLEIPGSELVLKSLKSISMSVEHFTRLFPFFIICFIYMKGQFGYGANIFNKTFGFISSLFKSNEWLDLIHSE